MKVFFFVHMLIISIITIVTASPEKNNDGLDDTVDISPECASVLILAGGSGGSFLASHLLSLIGFKAIGVAKGSFAAWWQSTMPLVSSGSLFASLQSIAMSGISSSVVIASSVGGAAAAKKLTKFCKSIDDLDPQSTEGKIVRKVAQTSKDAKDYVTATIDDIDPHSTQGKIIRELKEKMTSLEVPSWKDTKKYISTTINKVDPDSTQGKVIRDVKKTWKDAKNYISATIDDVDPHSTQGKIIEGAVKISNFEVPSWKDMKAYISKTIDEDKSKSDM